MSDAADPSPILHSNERLVSALPVVPAVVALLFGLLLLTFHLRDRAATRVADRGHHGSELLTTAFYSLKDVENAQRAYALTGDSAFLEAHAAARAAVASRFDELHGMVTSASERELVERLDSLARTRIAISQAVINARTAGGVDSAATIVARGEGARVMRELGAYVQSLADWLDRYAAARQAGYERRSDVLFWVLGVGTFLIVAATFASSWALLRHMRARAGSLTRLQESNSRLQEQTEVLEEQAAELQAQAVELEEATDALRQKEEMFRALVEHASDVIFVLGPDGRVNYVGASVSRILGHAPRDVEGTRLTEYIHADHVHLAESLLAGLQSEPRRVITEDLRLQHGTGTWCLMEVTAHNRLQDRAINGIVLNCHDVTQERLAQEQLRQSQKMEAVGRLAGGIAHDFNNLLTSIIGYAQLSLDEMRDSPVREDVEQILKAGQVASSLTTQLLAFSRQQVLRPEVVNVGDLVNGSAGMLRRLIGTDVELKTRVAPQVGNVLVDAGQLHQVVMNLVVNARDAMPEGGSITIETADAELSDEYVSKGHPVKTGPYVLLSVTDSGTGMPPEVRERIFEPFFTTKELGKGTGLGLSTTYGIVKQSGGYIWVYSEEGHGTTFKVYLPRVGDSRPAVAEDEREPVVAEGETILIVEDEDSVRAYARKVLNRSGYDVIDAANGHDALAILEERASDIRLILTDVIMPKMSGTAMTNTVREKYPGIRLLFTSGYPREEISKNGQLPANVAFIEKPYTPAQLLEAVRITIT